ncbi:MAG: hypothetical protein EPN94_05775 [Nitrospirae bacterium]|nr:MAG: hypothetical protein EPN94_05775 [Nitrospirota bacterium]
MKKLPWKGLAGFIAGLSLIYMSMPAQASATDAQTSDSLAGVWFCQSVYGGPFTGRSCRTWPWLKLNIDKSYTWGSEKGTWEFKDNNLRLSARKGKGRLNSDGQLIIEYESKGINYRQTLYKRN